MSTFWVYNVSRVSLICAVWRWSKVSLCPVASSLRLIAAADFYKNQCEAAEPDGLAVRLNCFCRCLCSLPSKNHQLDFHRRRYGQYFNMCQLRVPDTIVTQMKTQSLHKWVQFSSTVGHLFMALGFASFAFCWGLISAGDSHHSYPATWFTGLGSREWPQHGGSKNDLFWWFRVPNSRTDPNL